MIWHGDDFLAAVRSRLATNLGTGASIVAGQAAASVGGSYPPASADGQPPNRRTGTLQASITSTVDAEGLTARVGSTVGYALDLEVGTHRMAARPFLRPALADSAAEVTAAVIDGIGRPT